MADPFARLLDWIHHQEGTEWVQHSATERLYSLLMVIDDIAHDRVPSPDPSQTMDCAQESTRPCPFCGRSAFELYKWIGPWRVLCRHCAAEGPPAMEATEALMAWQYRGPEET